MQGAAGVRSNLRQVIYIGTEVFRIKFVKRKSVIFYGPHFLRYNFAVRLRTLYRTHQKFCATLVFTLFNPPIDITEVCPLVYQIISLTNFQISNGGFQNTLQTENETISTRTHTHTHSHVI